MCRIFFVPLWMPTCRSPHLLSSYMRAAPWQLFCNSCCVCVEHFLFQEDIETNLQKCTSPPHLSELPPSQLASLFVPRALHSIMLVAEVKAQRDHKIESVWKVTDLKWSSRWTSFVFVSTGTQPLNPHFPTIASFVTVAHYKETTRLKGSEINIARIANAVQVTICLLVSTSVY